MATMPRIRTFEELVTPNDPALRFTPLGFSTGGRMTPEGAAEHIQRSIGIELAPAVPDSTRQSFERVCLTHSYGLFAYDLFTVAEDHALLVLERAPRREVRGPVRRNHSPHSGRWNRVAASRQEVRRGLPSSSSPLNRFPKRGLSSTR